MPKKPSDSVQTVRWEFQDREREMLSAVATSTTIRNVGVGVGAILKPIADNLTVIMAAIIAHEGFQFLEDKANQWNENEATNRRNYELEAYANYLQVTEDNPVMNEEEYTRTRTHRSISYRRADWWQRNIGQPIRDGLGGWGSILSPFSD